MRAAQWRNSLARVGVSAPLWLVHDVGMLFTPEGQHTPIAIDDRVANIQGVSSAAERYRLTLTEIAGSEVVETARGLGLSDDLISVVLLRVLGPIYDAFVSSRTAREESALLPMQPDLYERALEMAAREFDPSEHGADIRFIELLAQQHLRLITAIELVDLDTLRLLGMFGEEAGAAGVMGMMDLLSVFNTPEAHDVVNFSLDLLPSVLETKKTSGVQRFSVDGYSGVTRRGSLDSLVLSELAFDGELFDRRFLEKEVFFYAREKESEEERHIHYVVVDASASMRGQRGVFARGLALTLIKKLQLKGEDVYLRFFDSRLYELQRSVGRTEVNVPYVLTFKGEHGRHYAKVFELLAADLERLQKRERKHAILYVLTHAECHIPRETVERLQRSAKIYGVYTLPSSGEIDVGYLDLLHRVQVVDEAALGHRDKRAERALEIVNDVDVVSTSGASRVNLNTASLRELAQLPGIGEQRAEAIVALREALPFNVVDELLHVDGIGDGTFAKVRDLVTV